MDSPGCQARALSNNLELDCTSTFGLLNERLRSDQDEYSLGKLASFVRRPYCGPRDKQAVASSVFSDCHLPPSQDPVGTSCLTVFFLLIKHDFLSLYNRHGFVIFTLNHKGPDQSCIASSESDDSP